MFLTSERCEGNEQSRQAFTSDGQLRCVRLAPETNLSPDGRWEIAIGDGIWLQTPEGEPSGQVSKESKGQVIWRPDSQGFFLATKEALYYITVPELSIKVVDDNLRTFPILYQWLDGLVVE